MSYPTQNKAFGTFTTSLNLKNPFEYSLSNSLNWSRSKQVCESVRRCQQCSRGRDVR